MPFDKMTLWTPNAEQVFVIGSFKENLARKDGLLTRASGSDGLLSYLCQEFQDRFIPSHRPYSWRMNHSR